MDRNTSLLNTVAALNGTKAVETKYLNEPYLGRIKITNIEFSEDIENYNKTPFFRFSFLTETRAKGSFVLWRPSGEDQEKDQVRLNKLKLLYDHCKVEQSNKIEYLTSIKNKVCKAAIQMRERFYVEQNGEPKIVSNPELWYSKPEDEEIKADSAKLIVRLSGEELEKYNQACANWNNIQNSFGIQSNTNSGAGSSTDDDF